MVGRRQQTAAHPPIGWCASGRCRPIAPPSLCGPARAGTAPCQVPALARQSSCIGTGTHTTIRPLAHRSGPDPSSTTRAAPTARCCTAPWPVIGKQFRRLASGRVERCPGSPVPPALSPSKLDQPGKWPPHRQIPAASGRAAAPCRPGFRPAGCRQLHAPPVLLTDRRAGRRWRRSPGSGW